MDLYHPCRQLYQIRRILRFYLYPHRPISKGDLPGFIVCVDEVERPIGLDFNNLFDDTVEDDIEDDIERMWQKL